MSHEADLIARQSAYVDTVRALGRRERNAGFVACLVGVLILIWARFVPGAPAFVLWIAIAVIVLGWGLFVWSVLRRFSYIRSHPFVTGEE